MGQSIVERLANDLKQAMRDKEGKRLSCIRMLKAKIQEKELALRPKHGVDYKITDEAALEAIAAYAKQRRDSIEAYEAAGRTELADKERAELEIIQVYLPAQLGDEELAALIQQAINETGANSMKQMGAVMKQVMPQTQGRADGKRVQQLVRQLLDA